MLRSILRLAYGAGGYAAGLASIAAVVAFLADLPFFKGVNAGDQGPIGPSIAINLGLIGLFGLHHSVTARRWFKARWTRLIPPALERTTYLWMSTAAVALLILFWQPVTIPLWQVSDPWAAGAIWAAFLAVWGLMFSATFPIGHLRFFGLAQVWNRVRGLPEPNPAFTARWLYGLVRHPISLGWMLVPWLTPQMTLGQITFAIGTMVYVLTATAFEEADLAADLGEAYRRYRREVPAFLPRLGRSRRRSGI
jgi:methanethiol S-methyltransferase